MIKRSWLLNLTGFAVLYAVFLYYQGYLAPGPAEARMVAPQSPAQSAEPTEVTAVPSRRWQHAVEPHPAKSYAGGETRGAEVGYDDEPGTDAPSQDDTAHRRHVYAEQPAAAPFSAAGSGGVGSGSPQRPAGPLRAVGSIGSAASPANDSGSAAGDETGGNASEVFSPFLASINQPPGLAEQQQLEAQRLTQPDCPQTIQPSMINEYNYLELQAMGCNPTFTY